MNPSIAAQAEQARVQGNQMLASDQATAANSKNDYTTYSNQATQANQNLQSETQYMQGAGSGTNVYNAALDKAKSDNGWDPQQLSSANKTLFSLNGALNSANNQFSTPGGVGAYGVSAPALASYQAGILQPLQTGVANANTQVGVLNNELNTLQTGAGQSTTAQVQSEQNTVTALDAAAKNYQTQAAAALQNMQFYDQLASSQGGLNAKQQADYASAQQGYAMAQKAMADIAYVQSQTTGQNIKNQADQAQLDAANKPAIEPMTKSAASAATSKPASSGPSFSWTNPSSSWHAVTQRIGANPSLGNTVKTAGDLFNSGVSGLGWLGSKAWNG